MAISLFEHNETAYYAALSMMKKTGKAAIVHPTGTGKSFIGFKLCEDNPNKKICWLSLICTPKVRQTIGGVYFYEKKRKKEQKILARIQNICYNGYARTSFELR